MRLPWQRRPRELEMAVGVHPLTGTVRKIKTKEVAQARADARADFERILPASMMAPPSKKR